MITVLQQPLKPRHALITFVSATLAVAGYCLAYTFLAGRTESPMAAIGWALANVLPWLVAFEAGKRMQGKAGIVAIVAACLAASLAVGTFVEPDWDLPFELARRVPALAAVIGLLSVGRMLGARRSTACAHLPLAPPQIDWIAAAGNYVELHSRGRTILHRATISRVAAELICHGFVRIHRSTLVRRDHIAQVRPLDVLLQDGTSLRRGHRYRAALHD